MTRTVLLWVLFFFVVWGIFTARMIWKEIIKGG